MPAYFGYVDRTLDGRPFYVGKGKIERVRLLGRRSAKHDAVATRFGQVRTVEFASSIEAAVFDWERETVDALGTLANGRGSIGCNLTRGGEQTRFAREVHDRLSRARQSRVTSDETRAKMSATMRAKAKADPSYLEKAWAARRAQRGYPSTYRCTEAHRAAISAAQRARGPHPTPSPEKRAKISQSLKGRSVPEEAMRKRLATYAKRREERGIIYREDPRTVANAAKRRGD